MTKYMRWTIVLVFIFAFALTACGGGDGGDTVAQATFAPSEEETEPEATAAPPTDTPEPTATNTPEPTATHTPEPTEEPTVDAPDIDLSDLNQGLAEFDSYRLNVTIHFEGTDAENSDVTADMQVSMASIVDPPAVSVSVTAAGIEELEQFGSMSMAQKDGTSYVVLPGLGCITSSEQEDIVGMISDEFLNTNEFTDKLNKARFVGEETRDGVEVLHYEVDSSMLEEDDDLDEIEGDVYLAKDGGYLVGMEIDGTGPIDFFGQGEDSYGTMHMEYNLTDINEVTEIALPEGCGDSAAAGGSEFPVTDDATELASFAGFTSYKTDMAFDDVVDFYETTLADEGWTKSEDDSFSAEGTAVLVYTRDDETLNLTIGADDEDTQFVLITSQ